MASYPQASSSTGKEKISIDDLPATAQAVVTKVCAPPPEFIDLHILQFSENLEELGLGPRIIDPFVAHSLRTYFPIVDAGGVKEAFSFECNPMKNPFSGQTRGFIPKKINTALEKSAQAWYKRIVEQKYKALQAKGIFDFLQFMALPFVLNENFLAALTSFWSVSTNTFHFQFGMMTPNLLDLAILFGLRPQGRVIDVNFEAYADKDLKENFDFRRGASYGYWVETYAGQPGTLVSKLEYVAFFLYWLSKYLICSAQFKVEGNLYPLACYLADSEQEKPVALGRYVLGNLYSGLNRLVTSSFRSFGGPLWILQIWGYAYFKSIRPTLVQIPDVSVHGLNFLCADLPFGTLSSYLEAFYHLDFAPTEQQAVRDLMELKPLGPVWLKEAMVTCVLLPSKKFWRSVLFAKDLPHKASLSFGKSVAGVELYNPHYAALQFGFKQYLPYPPLWTWNVDFLTRRPFTTIEQGRHVHTLGVYMLSNFYIPDDIKHPMFLPKTLTIDPEFSKFWAEYMLKRVSLVNMISAYGANASVVNENADVDIVDVQAAVEETGIISVELMQSVLKFQTFFGIVYTADMKGNIRHPSIQRAIGAIREKYLLNWQKRTKGCRTLSQGLKSFEKWFKTKAPPLPQMNIDFLKTSAIMSQGTISY